MSEPNVAFVTGASRAIGAATTLWLARQGVNVAIGYRSDPDGAEETAAKARAEGAERAIVVELDVTDEASVKAAFGRIETEIGPVKILVNNAGYTKDGLMLRYPMEAFDKTMNVNVRGTYLCTRRALPGMLRARWGRVINMASAAGIRANPGQVAYCGAKAAVVNMTGAMAREVGGRGITVNCVCPGFLVTKMTEETTEEQRELILSRTPAGRFGTPEDIAAVVAFLASPEASYVNGAVIPVDGGLTT